MTGKKETNIKISTSKGHHRISSFNMRINSVVSRGVLIIILILGIAESNHAARLNGEVTTLKNLRSSNHSNSKINNYVISMINDHACITQNPECWVSIENGRIKVDGYEGLLIVGTVNKVIKISKSQIDKLILYGPVQINYSNCSCMLNGRKLCTISDGDSTYFDSDCNFHNDVWPLTIYILLSMMMMLSYTFFRYVKIRFYPHVRNYEFVSIEGKVLFFFQKFRKNTAVKEKFSRVYYNAKLLQLSEIDETGVLKPSQYKSRTYNFKSILIAIFLFMHPVLSIKLGRNSSEQFFKSVIVNRGVSITTPHLNLHVHDYGYKFPLIHKYFTTGWDTKMEYDWHCSDSACNSHGKCSDHPRGGKFTSENFYVPENSLPSSKERWLLRRYCQYGATGCFLGTGCWKWVVKYIIKSSLNYTAYSVGFPESFLNVSTSKPNLEEIYDLRLKDVYFFESKGIVKDPSGAYHICDKISELRYPKANQLGDVQIDSSYKAYIAYDSVDCYVHTLANPHCHVLNSFVHQIGKLCHKIPTVYEGVQLNVENGFLVGRKVDNLVVVSRDQNEEIKMSMEDNCEIIKKEIWGVIGDGSGYFALIESALTNPNHCRFIHIPCAAAHHCIPCNGAMHKIPITSPEICHDSTSEFEIKVIASEHINLMDYSRMEGDPEENISFPSYWPLSTQGIFGTLFGSSTIFIIIGVYLLLKK